MKETMREQPVRASVYVDAGGRWSRQQCGWSHQREYHAAANQQTTGWEDLSALVRVFLSWSTCIQCWLLVVNLDACDLVIMPRPLGGALSNDAVWHLSVWRLSVAYIGPKSRTARSRKTKIGTEIAHVTRDSDTTFKVKRSKVKGQCHRGRGILWRPPAYSLLWAESWFTGIPVIASLATASFSD